MCKRHFVVGGHYMYLNCWFIFQGSLFLLVAGKNFKDDYIVFHDAYGTNTPAYIRDAQVCNFLSIENILKLNRFFSGISFAKNVLLKRKN
jgi:hypothetical protein